MDRANPFLIIAICGRAQAIARLSQQLTCDFKIIFCGQERLFCEIENQSENKSENKSLETFFEQLRSASLGLESEPFRIGIAETAARALVKAMDGDFKSDNFTSKLRARHTESKFDIQYDHPKQEVSFETHSVQFLFEYLSPFYNDVIDSHLQESILDWLHTLKIKTFGELRAQGGLHFPTQIQFLYERFLETEEEWMALQNAKVSHLPFEEFLSRIQNRIGAASVFAAHFKPEQTYSSRGTLNEQNPMRLRLPSRVLPVPVPLSHFETKLVAPCRQWATRFWSAPRRVTSYSGVSERDYFEIKTVEGEELWVFRDLANGFLYWHGVFD